MVDITALNHDLWYYISMNFLKFQEFQNLTQCNKYLNQMQWIDIIWKRYCQEDHKIQYKHPDQSYRDLYLQCKKRRACHHLQKVAIDVPKDLRTAWKDQNRCGRCDVEGIENLYICLSPGCHEIYCDRHTKRHMRNTRNDNDREGHVVYYKPNMSEIFCEVCVEWTGGIDANPAEQYYSNHISSLYLNALYENNMAMRQMILDFKAIRQKERIVCWKDTPQHIMNNERGYCFISSTWVLEWEMFIEGWVTEPPIHAPIDQKSLLQCIIKNLSAEGSDVYADTDTVTLMSKEVWDYVSKVYTVIGNRITEDDFKPEEMYPQIANRVDLWKKRAFY